ncbi:Maf family protein [Piscirickettsia litoralis]|uniref:dTTP/UTP pyrophosphatase n=1 Tax=Piscirickettsia litoralis TaxID=1891921 RepID=A0ABX3A157_9GAMM|nr:Maf family protein [Piscirickettsia litoralis]ODN42601.1 septum formation protein Maf [Piscirickettsia litoralis]
MSAQLYLASTSPRRRELLSQLHLSFQTLNPNINESIQSNEGADEYVLRMAREKAQAGLVQLPGKNNIILAADTAVVCDEHILGKPIDQADAQKMLLLLSGRSHWVYSAVSCVNSYQQESILVKSKVYFRSLTEQDIMDYWQTGEPCDKAGGYAIQGLAAIFIERLEGSFSAVMGLPLFETNALLQKFKIRALGDTSER